MIQTVHCVDALVGGVATVLLAYARACSDACFNFISIAPVDDRVKSKVASLGGRVLADGMADAPRLECAIVDARRSTGARVFHVHRNWHNLLPAIFARKAGFEVVISHSHNVFPSTSRLKDLYHAAFQVMIKRYADASWGCSPEAISFLYGACPKNPLLIPNPISFDAFHFSGDVRSAKRRELGLEGSYVLVHAGLPIPQKNHPFLLRVFAGVLKERPEAKLLLLGPDKARDSWLYDMAVKLGIAEAVIFCGYIEDVADYYAASDVFVFPSLNEGLSLALCEAQAEGLSFLASNAITRFSDLFGNGCFLPIDEGIAPWVEYIAHFKPERKIPTSDAIAACRFNVDTAAPLLSETYRALLDGASHEEIQRIWGEGL